MQVNLIRLIFLLSRVIFLFPGFFPLYGQDLRFQHFTSEQGLSENVVYSILQDKRGFLWIGTWDGLNRYDGFGFTKFYHKAYDSTSLPGNTIHSLYEDKGGRIWVGTNGGLAFYDPVLEKFSRYVPSDNITLRNILRITGIDENLILQTSDAILFLNTRSRKLDSVRFLIEGRPVLLSNTAVIFKNAKDGFLISFPKNLSSPIFRFNHREKIFEPDRNKVFNIPTGLENFSARHFTIDGQKQTWLATQQEKIFVFDSTGKLNSLNGHEILQKKFSVQCMYTDPTGNCWIGTEGGLLQYDIKTGVLQHYQAGTENGLSSPIVNVILEDRSGSLWIGTLNGLNKLIPRQKRFHHLRAGFQTGMLKNNFILGLGLERSGHLRIHYNLGIHQFSRLDLRSGTTSHYSKREYDRKKFIRETIIRNEEFLDENWLKYFEKRLNGKVDWTYLLPPHLISDGPNRVWYTTFIEFGYFQSGESGEINQFPLMRFKGEVFDMQMQGDRIWLATSSDGLVCYDITNKSFKYYQSDTKDIKSIGSNEVLTVLPEHGGKIWVGTKGGGLNYLDPVTGQFIHYTVEQGLCNNTIYCMVKDNDGMLWLGTSNGLSRFDPGSKSFRNYSRQDGLLNSEFNRYSAVKTTDGRLWFGGLNGIDHFHPSEITVDRHPTQMGITGIKIFDKYISPSQSLSLNHSENNLTFEFAVMDFRNPAANKFAFKLSGIDKDWVTVENRNFATYPALHPGRYKFQIKGANSEGIWMDSPMELSFRIRPPWWRTWWFYSICVFIFILTLYLLYSFRIRQLKKLLALRTKISQDLHDEVGSTLSGIALYSSLAKNQLGGQQSENAERSLDVIEHTATGMVDKLNDIVWAVNPMNDNLSVLLKRLEDYAYEMATARNIEVISQIDEQAREMSLPMDFRKNIYLVCKESINNAVKYAGCTVIRLQAVQVDHQFSFEIIDNGKGFDPGTVKMGNGLSNIKTRAREIRARLEIESVVNRGTRVKLTCKIPR